MWFHSTDNFKEYTHYFGIKRVYWDKSNCLYQNESVDFIIFYLNSLSTNLLSILNYAIYYSNFINLFYKILFIIEIFILNPDFILSFNMKVKIKGKFFKLRINYFVKVH